MYDIESGEFVQLIKSIEPWSRMNFTGYTNLVQIINRMSGVQNL